MMNDLLIASALTFVCVVIFAHGVFQEFAVTWPNIIAGVLLLIMILAVYLTWRDRQ